VGPRAPDDAYALLVWQMLGGGPEVTSEWARTDKPEVICRITHSSPGNVLIQTYVPWGAAPPAFANI
jgi:hypothetical protein